MMKNKFLYMAVILTGLFLITSCKKDEIGGTLAKEMAGEWYVTADAVDSEGNIVYEDFFGIGHFHLDSYNTSSNSMTQMWLDDNTNFWEFKMKVDINLDGKTFQITDADNAYYESKVTVTNGKILLGAATTPGGMPADSIIFNVTFDDDTYPEDYGFATYKIAGFRYTGLANDD